MRKTMRPVIHLESILDPKNGNYFVKCSFFLFLAQQPPVGLAYLIHEVSRSHTTTHHTRWDSSGRMIISSQTPLPDNTQHSQQTAIHAPGGIRTYNLSRQAAADLRLRPRSHWDRLFICYGNLNAARKLRH